MTTIHASSVDPDVDALRPALEVLGRHGVVAYPTDTVYGLAVDPFSVRAVQTLFELKGRDAKMAVPLIAASIEAAERALGQFDRQTRRLAEAFWPGPLSLVVAAPTTIAPLVHGGRGTVAVRVPKHGLARALARLSHGPITATSANLSGRPPAVTAAEIAASLGDADLLIVDGGAAPGGPPSTIVDVRGNTPVLLREGAIAWSRVLEFLHA